MALQKLFWPWLQVFSLLILSLLSDQAAAGNLHFRRPSKLFVFGDSYVDTGNIRLPVSSARKYPYGITFPGKPSGRFSDGRVLTDYTARFLGLRTPIPFTAAQKTRFRFANDGINFAYGGTGVFDTSFPFPNITTQIDFFQSLIAGSVLAGREIRSSVALVSVSGNDYSFYQARNGSAEGLRPFITSVVKQIAVNLKRIHGLGVKKVAVTGLGPLGCLPRLTAAASFRQCNATQNTMVEFHNVLLKQAVAELNNGTRDSPFFVLDLYGAFLSIIKNNGTEQGNIRFKTPLKPCCFGVSSEFSCGSVDEKGNKKYVLCRDPKSALFWDSLHPTQQGWFAAFSSLKAKSHLISNNY